jgi:thiol-disulfide isomerase/thioredoxin
MANAGNAQAQIPGLWASPIIVILAILCGLSAPARGQNAPPQILLEKAMENARSITNIEIQYDDMLWIKGKPISAAESNDFTRTMKTSYPFSQDFTRTFHITYTASGEKYRTESRNESPQSTNIIRFVQTTFDGGLWSEFNGSTSYMIEQDGDMPGDKHNPTCPLIDQFLFLSRDSDDCFPCGLRFTDLRSPDILNGLILPDAETSNGVLHLSFPGLPRNGVNQLWNITMDATNPDFTPRTISNISYASSQSPGDIENVYTLSDYTNLGAFHFPTKIAYSGFNVPTNNLLAPTLAATGMIRVVSVKIPAQIPDSAFRLDESKASRIWNTGETKGYGVGLILGEAGSNIVVKRIIADSPAGRQKELHAGDRILSIAESNSTAGAVHPGRADLPRAIALLQGAKGSAVRLTFVPSGNEDSQTHVVTLVRGEVRGRLTGGRLLTKGMKAPDMAMVTLTNRATECLSDYAGKIVVLEFWASWCSPCKKSMTDLQLDAARNPNWKDKVMLIAASVDDTADIAAKCIQERGWNQTHNVWLGDKDIKTYPVGGIPTAYVIDAKGTIIDSGIPAQVRLNIPNIVNQQLDAEQMKSKKD